MFDNDNNTFLRERYFDHENMYSILAFLLSVISIFTFDDKSLSLSIAIVETLIVFYFLIRSNICRFVISYLLFSSVTIESSLFTLGEHSADLFSFFQLPYIHYYQLFFMIFFAYFINLKKNGRFSLSISTLSGKMIILFYIECLVTLVSFLINDNGINEIDGILRFIIIDAYNTVWIVFLFALLWDLINNDSVFRNEIRALMLGVLIGVACAGIVAFLMNKVHVNNESASFLIVPIVMFFSPGLVLFYFQGKRGYFYFAVGILSIIIQLKYSVGIPGAWWMYIALIGVSFVVRLFFNLKKHFTKCIIVIAAGTCALVFWVLPTLVSVISGSINIYESYIVYKFTTMLDIINIKGGSNSWYQSLGNSIGVRVDAIVNGMMEITRNPVYFFFGKGFGGTIKNNWGIYNWNIYGSTYPDVQINSGVYSSFHTGIAELIVNNGFCGVGIIIGLIIKMAKDLFQKNDNGWIVIGSFWLLVFLYFYHSMFICVPILVYGLYLSLKKD